MNKIIIILSILFVSGISNAQVGFGIKGAITVSKLTTDISDYSDAAKAGFQIGTYVRIGKGLHLQPEAYYSLKSGKIEYDYLQEIDPGNTVLRSVDQSLKFHTIDVPVLVGVRVLKLPSLNVRLHAGPVASFTVSKNFEVSFDGLEVDPDESPIIATDFNNVNWGLQFGGGIDFLFITADLRYELGLNNVYKSSSSSGDDQTFKKNVFFLNLGFKIL